MFNEKKYEFEINGIKCSFSSGVLARVSQVAVTARMGDTVVLATVNTAAAQSEAEFFPMTVEYIEKMYAAGKISGSRFIKRERFPSDEAILRARMLDRSFRPRFADDYRNEVQIIVKVLSFDESCDPSIVAINAASAALMLSRAPFEGPIAAVRVGIVGDKATVLDRHVNLEDMGDSSLNLVVAGDGKTFTNIDSNSNEVSEDKMVEAMELSLEAMKPWLDAQSKFVALFEEIKKPEYTSFAVNEEAVEKIMAVHGETILADIGSTEFKEEMKSTLEALYVEHEGKFSKREIREAYEKVAKKQVKKLAFEKGKRVDGRDFTQIRPVDVQTGLLPRAHGTGLFSRGMTQVLTVATLGTSRDQQEVDDMTGENAKRYRHFYMEEPYAHGEAGRVAYIPGRRQIGHGSLAEKALYPVLPSMETFPYTIILMSEIMSEQGSSSMASTCGSSLALMDAGVPITKPVAGIAVGIITEDDKVENYKLVTDLVAAEDFFGGMDFKVTGTKDGITAIQMDTKTKGLPLNVFKEALLQSKEARLEILEKMNAVISTPKASVSEFAPKVAILKVPVEKIGELIGPGGKNIKAMMEETGAEFDIEDDGSVRIFSMNEESMTKAKAMVSDYSFVPVVGTILDGVVEGTTTFGAFVEIARGVSGLVHVSELADKFVKDVNEIVKVGDKVKVKIIGLDDGKIKLSMKQVNSSEKKE